MTAPIFMLHGVKVSIAAGVLAGVTPDAMQTKVILEIFTSDTFSVEFAMDAEDADKAAEMLKSYADAARRYDQGDETGLKELRE